MLHKEVKVLAKGKKLKQKVTWTSLAHYIRERVKAGSLISRKKILVSLGKDKHDAMIRAYKF